MAQPILITDHAVKRYRQRTIEDQSRLTRREEQVRAMILSAITSHPRWPELERIVSSGIRAGCNLEIEIKEYDKLIATHNVVLAPSHKGRSYVVKTYT